MLRPVVAALLGLALLYVGASARPVGGVQGGIRVGAKSGEIPTVRNSVRPLSRHILDARHKMKDPVTMTSDGKSIGLEFAKFNTHDAVNLPAYRDVVNRLEDPLLRTTKPREGLYGLIDLGDEALGKLTSRSDRYNMMYLDDPVIGEYFWLLKRGWHKFMDKFGIDKTKRYYIHSWSNCLRRGQRISWHTHGNTIYSGSFMSTVNGSSTIYGLGEDGYGPAQLPDYMPKGFDFPKKQHFVNPNSPADLVFFDSMIPHRTTEVDAEQEAGYKSIGQDCRISSSWDITPFVESHCSPFYDPEDPFFEKADAGEGMARDGQKLSEQIQAEHGARMAESEMTSDGYNEALGISSIDDVLKNERFGGDALDTSGYRLDDKDADHASAAVERDERGELLGALKSFEAAAQFQPSSASHFNLASVYADEEYIAETFRGAEGRAEALKLAVEHLRHALRLAPGNSEAKELLDSLQSDGGKEL